MGEQNSHKIFASTCSFVGAVLFAILIVLFNTIPQNIVAISVVAIVFHIALFPVVAALPAPEWARAGGYGWLILDISSNIMLMNGVDEHFCTALRLGAHIPAVVWIITSSLKRSKPIQFVGITQAIFMGGYSFVAVWAPK